MNRSRPEEANVGKPAAKPLFLERQSYKRRRLTDAAKLLPLLGAALFLVPLLWSRAGTGDDGEPVATSLAIAYIFGIWAVLIGATVVLGMAMRHHAERKQGGGQDAD